MTRTTTTDTLPTYNGWRVQVYRNNQPAESRRFVSLARAQAFAASVVGK